MSFSLHAEPATEADAGPRRSARERQEPVRLQSEQEGDVLSRDEAADIRAAIILSQQEGEEAPDAVQIVDLDSEKEEEEEEEEEEKKGEPASELGWFDPARLRTPPPMSRFERFGAPMRLPAVLSRLSLLQLFLTDELLQSWAHLTNDTAGAAWHPTDVHELHAFVGMNIFMGVDQLPDREMYWSAATRHTAVACIMSRNRFKELTRYLSVSPPVADAARRNPFTFVRAFIDSVNESFTRHWNPGRHLALDESIVGFRGRSDIKQFVPGKPHPHGYKIWVLGNENYMLQLQLYQGKEIPGPSLHDMVLELTQLYRNNNHVLYIDSLFTSPTLVDSLYRVGIRVCGSVKRNRVGMPPSVVLPPDKLSSIPRGSHHQLQKGNVTLCAWRDKKLVLLLYNHSDPNKLTSMTRWNDSGEGYELTCPQAIRDYFHHARAIDVINQLHYSYLPGKKSRKCWTRLVWWLIDICILNAYRLWQVQHPKESHLDFRMRLAQELMDCLPAERRPQRAAHPPPGGTSLAKDHFPIVMPSLGDCVHCSKRDERRARSQYGCAACNAHLCITPCFGDYHQ